MGRLENVVFVVFALVCKSYAGCAAGMAELASGPYCIDTERQYTQQACATCDVNAGPQCPENVVILNAITACQNRQMALCTWPQMQDYYNMAGVKASYDGGWFYTGTSCGGSSYTVIRFTDLWEQCRSESESVTCEQRYIYLLIYLTLGPIYVQQNGMVHYHYINQHQPTQCMTISP